MGSRAHRRAVTDGLGSAHARVATAEPVREHVSRIMTKAQVRDRAQLVILAYESGLTVPTWLGRT